MLKESETEEARRFCHLFLIGEISIGGGASPCFPPGYTYVALAMIARSWLFCYDMLGYYITKPCLFFTLNTITCFILSTDVEAKARSGSGGSG